MLFESETISRNEMKGTMSDNLPIALSVAKKWTLAMAGIATMCVPLLFGSIHGWRRMTTLLTQAAASTLQSNFRIIFGIRVYQRVGPSHVDWLEMSLPDRQAVKLTDIEKTRCFESPRSPSAETKTRAELSIVGNGKLLTWSADGTMFAYVDRDLTVPPPTPNPFGCEGCFYSDLKVSRAIDTKVLASIRLPERSERWNYPQSIAWLPDGKTLLVGAEAGSSDSHFENYWLLDWTNQSWRYAGGGNDAKWSPDASQILWATPRHLAALGKIRVWVVHLALLDVRSLKQEILTSGTSYVSDFYWCSK